MPPTQTKDKTSMPSGNTTTDPDPVPTSAPAPAPAPGPGQNWTCVAAGGDNALGVSEFSQWGNTFTVYGHWVPTAVSGVWGAIKRHLLRHKKFRDWAAANRIFGEIRNYEDFEKADKAESQWAGAALRELADELPVGSPEPPAPAAPAGLARAASRSSSSSDDPTGIESSRGSTPLPRRALRGGRR